MNEFEGKVLFFDFDGTLANSEDYHRESMYLTLKKFGLTKEQTNFYIGKGMHDTDAEEVWIDERTDELLYW